eukprot:2369983-Rhodomonas_salina.1
MVVRPHSDEGGRGDAALIALLVHDTCVGIVPVGSCCDRLHPHRLAPLQPPCLQAPRSTPLFVSCSSQVPRSQRTEPSHPTPVSNSSPAADAILTTYMPNTCCCTDDSSPGAWLVGCRLDRKHDQVCRLRCQRQAAAHGTCGTAIPSVGVTRALCAMPGPGSAN